MDSFMPTVLINSFRAALKSITTTITHKAQKLVALAVHYLYI